MLFDFSLDELNTPLKEMHSESVSTFFGNLLSDVSLSSYFVQMKEFVGKKSRKRESERTAGMYFTRFAEM